MFPYKILITIFYKTRMIKEARITNRIANDYDPKLIIFAHFIVHRITIKKYAP